MSERFFVDRPIHGPRVTLAGTEAHHLIHVMRAKPGLQVTVFDGSGDQWQAMVETIRRSEAELLLQQRESVDREPPCPLILGVSLPKGDRQKWLIEKVVEVGVTRLVPLTTARSVAQPTTEALARLQRAVIEASKQCGRNRLMELAPPQTWAEFLTDTASTPARYLAHPYHSSHITLNEVACATALAVGPEGGFSEEEVKTALDHGWKAVDLGPRILRVETAAVVLATLAERGKEALRH